MYLFPRLYSGKLPNIPACIITSLALAFCFLPFQVAAQNIILLKDDIGSYQIGKQVEILEDKEKQWTIDNITTEPLHSGFQLSEEGTLSFGFTSSAYWLRFQVKNEAQQKDWYLEAAHPILDYVDLYAPNSSMGGYRSEKLGDLLPFRQRKVGNRNFVYRLRLSFSEEKTYYLRVESKGSMNVPLTLWSPEAFSIKDHNEQFGLGLFFGVMVVMAVYNLFLFFFLRDFSYLHYVFFIGSLGLYQMSVNGLAYEYLWPAFPWWANVSTLLFLGLAIAGLHSFTRSFLATSIHTPRMNQIHTSLYYTSIILTVMSFFLPVDKSSYIISLAAVPSFPLCVISGIITLRRGYRPALYFLIAWTAFLFGAFIYAMVAFGIIQNKFFTTYGAYGLQAGSMLGVILLSLGLAYRINLMRQETEEAQLNLLNTKQKMLNAFERFVPLKFLHHLGRESVVDVNLGDQVQKVMTVLFSDIRSFTTISESMTPEENFNFINGYLGRMGPIIRKHDGFIDKYVGDAIMALFPGDPDNALDAAIEMQATLADYNEGRIKDDEIPIRIGIGLHKGSLMLGTVGEEARMEGTVISDAVNLASRMESLTKSYGAAILVTGALYDQLHEPEKYTRRYLGKTKVKGKTKAVDVVEILDTDPPEVLELKRKTRDDFERGIGLYLKRRISEAMQIFEKLLLVNPEDKAILYSYKRCQLYLQRRETAKQEKTLS